MLLLMAQQCNNIQDEWWVIDKWEAPKQIYQINNTNELNIRVI